MSTVFTETSVDKVHKVLSGSQVEAFRRNGYHFPIRVMPEALALELRAKLEAFEARHGLVMKTPYRNKPHLVFKWLNDLMRRPEIIDPIEDLYGVNLLAWSSSFFIKEPHDPAYISWHQDSTYWGLSHPDVVTAWVALSQSDEPSGVMRVLPGSHLIEQLPHKDTFARDNLLTRGQEVQVDVDEANVVDMPLSPGEMSLHHVRIVHGSKANRSDRRRIGVAIRYVPTYLHQTAGPRDYATLVRGVDTYHHFEPDPVPKSDLHEEAVVAHRESTALAEQILYRGTDKVKAGGS